MKLSLRWIFDHIDADWKKVDILDLVDKFNKTTAEIEGFEKFKLDLDNFALVRVVELKPDKVKVFCDEWKKEIDLSKREDVSGGDLCLVKKVGKSYEWAKLVDFNCQKDGFVPPVYVEDLLIDGGWKKNFEKEDYIIEVDNKSITHRPDMWCHRGFAREIAAIFNFDLKSEGDFVKEIAIEDFDKSGKDNNGFIVKVEDPEIGKRFAGLYIPKVKNRASSLWMASRLMRVGSRPIDFIVDVTNYVMQDIGQPMHAFDVDKLSSKTIVPRLAKSKEKLVLLDDSEIELTPKDYVITDGKKPIALAGVMGGKYSEIDSGTNSIFIESANFDAASVRNSAIRARTRTESSSRFEKTLDPNQNVSGIFRLLKLFDDEGIKYEASQNVISIGEKARALEVILSHDYIEKLLGVKLDSDFVKKVFEKLDFDVEVVKKDGVLEYKVIVPTFRCTKDIEIEQDLVEEVGRFFGYENTKYVLPEKMTEPYDLQDVLRIRQIGKLLSYGLKMRQVRNYAFYDESFLAKLNYDPKNCKEVSNPVSANWKKLVTSLVPHLLKNVEQNSEHYDQLRFFEFARIWLNNKKIEEKKMFSGIFFDKNKIDFYCAKSWVNSVFDMLGISVEWVQMDVEFVKKFAPWYFPYKSARIIFNDQTIGYAGKVAPGFSGNLFEGDSFVFELDGDFLLNYKVPVKKLKPMSKYPEVIRDVSMLVPVSVTVRQISEAIMACDKKIKSVYLVDLFQKDEWKDKKSLTFRFILQDYSKTLDKQEVDSVYDLVVSSLQKVGAELR